MNSLSRVVWSEGMHLGPHQFQAQARFVEDSIRFAIASLWPFQFGLTGIQLDAEALLNGTVAVVDARGILPDGTPFHMKDREDLPAARSLKELFPPTSESVTVSLAIPERRSQGRNLADSNDPRPARYRAEIKAFSDENSGMDERPVTFARKNMQLLFDMESGEGHSALPIARVVRDGSGHFRYDPSFVPPCLQIGASEALMNLLKRLIEILSAKNVALSRTSGSGRDYSYGEIANFWLLHAINSSLAPLTHQFVSKRGHPEELFVELSRLGGALCTFALNSDPSSLPAYDHRNPGPCFAALDAHIRKHLEMVVPTNCLSITLEKTAQYYYSGEVTDTRCFGRSNWILAVRSPIGDTQLITLIPQLVKVCSAKFVAELVRRAIAGLPLRHLAVPPAAMPSRTETQCFGISKEGPFWDNIVQTRGVGIYVPGDIPGAELELFVVLEA